MNLKCLIVDDEQLARDMLEAYALRISGLEVIGKCKHANEAHDFLKNTDIDLMLLDIQMPNMTGLEFLRKIKHPPMVIFTTAYSDYALESYELEVVDYLLKPIGFDRFEKAIIKAQNLLKNAQKAKAFEESEAFPDQFLIVKEGYNHHKIFWKDILYIKAMQEYSAYHTRHGRILELKTLSHVIKTLPNEHFNPDTPILYSCENDGEKSNQ